MQPLVSVIVPVYNVEKWLKRCLDSLCRQSLPEIEILLIDDASPDQCGTICDEYAAKDSRFRVIHHPANRGISEARNTGIANAYGDYLMFVDSDDWVHEDFCKAAYDSAVKYHADLVMFCCRIIKEKGFFVRQYKNTASFSQSGYKSRSEALDLMQRGVNRGVGNAAWNKLYRRELFKNIVFPSGFFFEDIGTIYKVVWRATRIYYLAKDLYYYVYNEGSITFKKTEKALNDRFVLYIQQYQDLKSWGYPKDKLNVHLLNIAIDYCVRKEMNSTCARYEFCKSVLLNGKSIPANFSWERKVLLVLFRYFPFMFEWICYMYNKKYYSS